MISRRSLLLAAALSVVLMYASSAEAVCPCGHCCQPAFTTVEQTIMVPVYEQHVRKVPVTLCKPVHKQREVTVCCPVPVVKQVEQTCTVMVPEKQTHTEEYTVCRTTWTEEERTYTVGEPEVQQRTCTRLVCKPEPVQMLKIVCEDQGHWETAPCDCTCCAPHKVWVPNVVQHKIPVTVMKPNYVEEPYTYSVTVMKPVTKTCTVKVPHHSYETKTREVTCMVPVPKQVKRMVNVVTYKTEQKQVTQHYTELVPYTVEREICVPVCKMVPKKVVRKVPLPCPVCGGHW